jgi:hypothetical protein
MPSPSHKRARRRSALPTASRTLHVACTQRSIEVTRRPPTRSRGSGRK